MCGSSCVSVWMWEAARVVSWRLLRETATALRWYSRVSCRHRHRVAGAFARASGCGSLLACQSMYPKARILSRSHPRAHLWWASYSQPPYSHSLDRPVFVPGLCTLLLHCLRNVCVVSRKLHNPQWSVYKSILGSLFSLIIYESNPSNWWITVIVFKWSLYMPLHLHDFKFLSWYKYLKC
jgi:hypothetical protein